MQDSHIDPATSAEAALNLLVQAAKCAEQKQDEEALRLNRDAMKIAMDAFQNAGAGECLYRALQAYRGIAVSAFLTGRQDEGAMALATGLAHAELGLRHWPDAPPLVEEHQYLQSLANRIRSNGVAHISEDLSSWPFDD
jgi:hypothetical protein